ncbi:MAG: hypothetical protein WC977_07965 [Anaerovoracaceae bacterium]
MKDFGKLAIGVPLFRMVPEFWLWWTWLVARGFRAGDILLNDAEIPMEVPHPVAHNALARAFLATDADTLLLIEDDHCGDEEVVHRMRDKEENWGFDVVCASYVNRRGQPWPVGCGELTGMEAEQGLEINLDLRRVAESGTQETSMAALGLVFIRRPVLEAMLGDEDPESFLWFQMKGGSSLDMWFYREVKRLGFRAGVDRDEWLGHVGRHIWTKNDYDREYAALKSRLEKAGG